MQKYYFLLFYYNDCTNRSNFITTFTNKLLKNVNEQRYSQETKGSTATQG